MNISHVFCPTPAGENPLIKSLNLACPKANSVGLLGLLLELFTATGGNPGRGETEDSDLEPEPGVVEDVGSFTTATLG